MKKVLVLVLTLLLCLLITSCKDKISKAEATKLYLSALDSYSNQKYDEASAYLVMLKKHDSKFYQADLLAGKIQFFQNDFLNALVTFKKLTKKYPQYVEARIWYIRTLIIAGQFELAKTLLETELSFNQTDWRIFYLYSLLEEKQGNIDKKIVMLNRAEMALSDSAKVYLELGEIWNLLDIQERSNEYNEKAKIIASSNESLNLLKNIIKQ